MRKKLRFLKPSLRFLLFIAVICLFLTSVQFAKALTLPKAHIHPLAILWKLHKPVCSDSLLKQQANCGAKVVVSSKGQPITNAIPLGYGPVQFHTAYSLPDDASGIRLLRLLMPMTTPMRMPI